MADGSIIPLVIDQASGPDWHLYCGDSCEIVRGLPTDSLHYTIYSPPFISLYTFSDDPRDVSNNNSDDVFYEHYRFLLAEIYRATMPGRLTSVHVMNLPTSKLRDGFIGIKDFRGDVIRAHEDAGFIFHSEVVIWKDPVSAMQRTKSIGLLHKQIVKDSAMSRMAIPDYVVTFRKPGDNPEPCAGPFTEYHGEPGDLPASDPGHEAAHIASSYSVKVWQRYASPVWMDIHQQDVLTHRTARDEADERHISPLQLGVIRRCVDLWTNPGDVVFSPFAGIGSELYVAVEMGRRGLGCELKRSYFDQAVRNLEGVRRAQGDLLTTLA